MTSQVNPIYAHHQSICFAGHDKVLKFIHLLPKCSLSLPDKGQSENAQLLFFLANEEVISLKANNIVNIT